MTRTPGDTVVVQWNRAALRAVCSTRLGPPMAARALAILHTSIFDAWSAYDPVAVGTSVGDIFRRPAAERDAVHKTAAISHAAHGALKDLFPTEVAHFDALMSDLGLDPPATRPDLSTAAGVGALAARRRGEPVG